jgi:propanediol utilization protein
VHYYSEKDIQDIVAGVLARTGLASGQAPEGKEIPVEISARHVHLSKADVEALFGKGYSLTRKRDLSQPGQYLCEERVKLVTEQGQIASVAVLGPERGDTQVELSLTDARSLGLKPPIRLSGDLRDACDVIIVGPKGVVTAKGSVIVAKAHIHMTPQDARDYGVCDGDAVSIRLGQNRSITLHDVLIRVNPQFRLAVHIDFDEANAAQVGGSNIVGTLIRSR